MSGQPPDLDVQWSEWSMISHDRQSVIKLPAQPLHVSAAYSGRIACAYHMPGDTSVVTACSDGTTKFKCTVAVYECESTGGTTLFFKNYI